MISSVSRIRQHVRGFDFGELFREDLGWDHFANNVKVQLDGFLYQLSGVAEKRGLQVYVCAAGPDGGIPDSRMRARIDTAVAKLAFEHLIIYVDSKRTEQVWQWSKRESGKPVVRRQQHYYASQPGDALVQRIQAIAFGIQEEERLTIIDVAGRVRQAFDVERITRTFYERFTEEHSAFLRFVEGISGEGDRAWYASLMLNRLMFVYFIQKKGFLDGDPNYLWTKLRLVQERTGPNRFLSFYRQFLLRLFHEGLGRQKRTAELDQLLGRVPYLNGGLFEIHELEESYTDIEIPDKAFEKLFHFFDAFQWHLDDRPRHADNEINPDVLGYIFEKYVNQKEMGAYYSKEDITGYISESTVIPSVFDAAAEACAIAFRSDGVLWGLLRENPDRYLRFAQLRPKDQLNDGVTAQQTGEAPKAGGGASKLPYDGQGGRVIALRDELARGLITNIASVVLNNLDARQLAQDAIENCEGPELLRAFYQAITSISILDPTCGSGAFLFAALNVLEPLYEACLERMHGFVEEAERLGAELTATRYSDFREILRDMERHPSRRYFVHKSIIVNNLYGVDVMQEAIEICKLRLFLKLVAQVEPDSSRENAGLEPLPDIDFNIRCGNALVGFASLEEVRQAIAGATGKQGILQLRDSLPMIEVHAQQADEAFRAFRQVQVQLKVSDEELQDRKRVLKGALGALRRELDQWLADEHWPGLSNRAELFGQWKATQRPFHWFVEFYSIVSATGFGVIVGNPPYVEVPRNLSRSLLSQTFRSALDRWSRDEDLYTFIVERSLRLLSPATGKFGMVLPLSLAFSTKRSFQQLRDVLASEEGQWLWSHYDRIPSALFGNEVRTRNTIAILHRSLGAGEKRKATTSLRRWEADQRELLFPQLTYAALSVDIRPGIPKVGSQIQADTLGSMLDLGHPLGEDLLNPIPFGSLAAAAPRFPKSCVFVGGVAYNWFPAWRDIPPTTTASGKPSVPARTAGYRFPDDATADVVFALLCSSLGYWWWAVASDGFNLKKWLMERFPIGLAVLSKAARSELAGIGARLRVELKGHYVFKENRGKIGNYFLPACGNTVRAIDRALVRHIPCLSEDFFVDVRAFNSSFSRAEIIAESMADNDDRDE